MTQRYAWVDSTGMLIGHGYMMHTGEYEHVAVDADFDLMPMQWRLVRQPDAAIWVREEKTTPATKSLWRKVCSLVRPD